MSDSLRWLFCNYEFPPIGGGGGTCSRYLAKEIAARGHDVEVLTAAFGDLPRRETREGYRVTRIAAMRKLPGQSRPLEMATYAASAFLRMLFGGGQKPDVIVSFHSIPSGMPAWPVSVLRGIPHIVHFQGGDVPGWLPGELDKMHQRTLWLNRAIVHQSVAALANSNGLAALAQPSFPKQHIGVLRGGVDTEHFSPAERRTRTGLCRLLFAGRLTTQKGLDVLLKALGRVHKQSADAAWNLDVAGDGPRRAEFEALAASEGIASRVTFHGFLSREEVRARYDAADVFAFPSRFEGMPNVVLEAMACGLPIIGTRIAGTEELVEPCRNGVLLPVDDLDALASACLRFVTNRDERLTMGDNSRRLVLEKWTWAARAKELETITRDILAKKSTGGRT